MLVIYQEAGPRNHQRMYGNRDRAGAVGRKDTKVCNGELVSPGEN